MNPFAKKVAGQIEQMWQCRVLRASHGKLRQVVLVMLAKEYAGAMPVLLRVAFPGFQDLSRPMLTGYATIVWSGHMVCDLMDRDGIIKRETIYGSVDEFIGEVRRLADLLKLNDKDREEMFVTLQKWVVADRRINHEGRRRAS
jgi:hypothetical protein